MDLQTQLQELKTSTQAKLAEMRGEHSKELQELRVAVLGKKGSLTDLLKGLKDLPNEERPKVGKMVNEVRDVLTEAFDEAAKVVEAAKIQAQLDSESLDVTLPGRKSNLVTVIFLAKQLKKSKTFSWGWASKSLMVLKLRLIL